MPALQPAAPASRLTQAVAQAEPWRLLLTAFGAGAAATLVLAGLALPLGWLLALALR